MVPVKIVLTVLLGRLVVSMMIAIITILLSSSSLFFWYPWLISVLFLFFLPREMNITHKCQAGFIGISEMLTKMFSHIPDYIPINRWVAGNRPLSLWLAAFIPRLLLCLVLVSTSRLGSIDDVDINHVHTMATFSMFWWIVFAFLNVDRDLHRWSRKCNRRLLPSIVSSLPSLADQFIPAQCWVCHFWIKCICFTQWWISHAVLTKD